MAPERAYLAFSRLETAFNESGVPSRFVDLCGRLIEANPQDWRARLALGQYHGGHGEHARALDLLFESLVHNPHALAIHQAIWRTLTTLEFDSTLVRRYVSLTHDAVLLPRPSRLHAVPVSQHRAPLAMPPMSRVEHLRRRANHSSGG